jgi:Flp pilus assembly protein TadD
MAEMRRALDLDPEYATAHHWYGLFLQQYLRRDEAITELRRAVALDPSQPVFWTDLASILRGANRLGEAEAVLQQASQMHQGFPEIYTQLADLAQARGEMPQAVVLLRRAVALGDNRARILSRLGCLEGTTGNPAGVTEALHLLRDMEATGQHVPDDALAALLAWTGDLEGAFRHIRRALDQRQDWVGQLLEAEGCFEPLSHDPRWRDVRIEVERATWLPLGSRPAVSSRASKGKLPQRGPFNSAPEP